MKLQIGPSLLVLSCATIIGCGHQLDNTFSAPAREPSAAINDRAKGQPDFPSGRIVDLTHAFDEQTIYWPTAAPFQLIRESAGVTERGYYYAANRFAAAEHGGTHIDAPIHFYQAHDTVEAIGLQRLLGAAVVIDVTQQCARQRDYQIGVDDLRNWEVQHDRQLIDVIVLLRTGLGRFWPDREKYLGTAEIGEPAVAKLHFPGLHPDAARWLVEQRMIKAIGIDTASIDHGQSQDFQSHVKLFEHNVPVFENLAQLDELPLTGFFVIALPMKIRGGSGGPLRIIAIVRDDESAKS